MKTPTGALILSGRTEGNGQFSFPEVPPGSYILSISADGFRQSDTALQIKSGRPSPSVSVTLEVAGPASMVTVTANRGTAESVNGSPQMVTVRSREELSMRLRPTIAHALENAPGVMLQQTTQGSVSPHLRGLTGYQTLLMLDGVRLNTSIFRSGPNQYLGWLDSTGADRLEVALGPGGAAFGSDAMGGTINVITTEASAVRGGSLGFHGEFAVQGASADLSGATNARVLWTAPKMTWIAGGSVARFNDLRAGDGADSRNAYRRFFGLDTQQVQSFYGDRLQDTGYFRGAGDMKFAYRPTSLQSVTLYYQHADERDVRSYRDQYGGIGRIQALFAPQTLDFAYARYEKVRLGFLDSVTGSFSVNSQKDGFIQQNQRFIDPVVTDDSYVRVKGYSGQGTTHIGRRQVVVFGAEVYDEAVSSYRFQVDPLTRASTQQRALYPNGSRYVNSGYFVQDTIELVPNRLRMVAGLRFTDARYYTHASANFDRNGTSLGIPDSSQQFRDSTYNLSINWQVNQSLGAFAVISRGFRAPNVNDLGTVGARTLGYDVPAQAANAVNALFGVDSGDGAGSTGKSFGRLGAERLLNYEVGLRVSTSKFYGRIQAFDAELLDPITVRTLLFPVGQVPAAIAGVGVFPLAQSALQRQQGVVPVGTEFSPRAVHAAINDGRSRYMGIEGFARYTITSRWRAEWNYSFLSGRDLLPVRPIRRLPPQEGGMRIWYVPSGRRPWFMVNTRLAGAQARLNGGDLDDDRIGASRRRSDIASFFTAAVNDRYIEAGTDGRRGTADDRFTSTGETLLQIQNRVLPVGSTISGVTVTGDGVRVPMYTRTAGWLTLDIHSGLPVTEQLSLQLGVSNLLDRNYRVHGSGVDAPGFSAYVGARYVF